MESQPKKVGVLGGSFNPVHLGHLHIAKELKSHCRLDEVWFIPAYQNPHKPNQPSVSVDHRLEMVRLAIQEEPSFKVLDIECKRKGPSYTVDTLVELSRKFPENSYYLLLGSDTMKRFHEWKDPYKILKIAKLVVASRDEEFQLNFGDDELVRLVKKAIVSLPLVKISSTNIRSLIASNGEFDHLLPSAVADYIRRNNLYQ